jgi:hypothetical protein
MQRGVRLLLRFAQRRGLVAVAQLGFPQDADHVHDNLDVAEFEAPSVRVVPHICGELAANRPERCGLVVRTDDWLRRDFHSGDGGLVRRARFRVRAEELRPSFVEMAPGALGDRPDLLDRLNGWAGDAPREFLSGAVLGFLACRHVPCRTARVEDSL